MAVDELAEHIVDAEGREVIARLQAHAAEVRRMTREMMRALRSGDPPASTDVRALVDGGRREAEAMLRAREIILVSPHVQLEVSTVFVTQGHETTLGNILTNAAALRAGMRIELRGRVVDEWFYRLEVRDHGVDPGERDATLAKINKAFRAQSSNTDAEISLVPDVHRGYGVALLLGRLLVIRNGGWLDVRAPETGPGVTFVITLPRVAPATIPPDAYAAIRAEH
jgi:signal transduction histidine kinase